MLRFLALAGGVTACVPVEADSRFDRSNLEPARITPSVAVERGRVDIGGLLQVESAGAETELVVQNPSTEVVVEVVSPGRADLSAFAGTEVRVALARDVATGAVSVSLLERSGQVLYLLEPIAPGALTDATFGPGLVWPANDLGPARGVAWEAELQSAWIRTEGGDVELFPGQPQRVWIDGATYRAVLIAAYDLTSVADGCSLPTARLSYELVRVEGDVDETPLVRDPAVSLVGEECADAP